MNYVDNITLPYVVAGLDVFLATYSTHQPVLIITSQSTLHLNPWSPSRTSSRCLSTSIYFDHNIFKHIY